MDKSIFLSLIFLASSISSLDLENNNEEEVIVDTSTKYNSNSTTINNFESFDCDKVRSHKRLRSSITSMHCQNLNKMDSAIDRGDPNNVDQFDTLTQSDIVRKQYSTLPYPAVRHSLLAVEKKHYEKGSDQNEVNSIMAYGEKRTTPFSISFGITLEAVNHFLFEGKNHFRYEI